jgi:hypothetical protein
MRGTATFVLGQMSQVRDDICLPKKRGIAIATLAFARATPIFARATQAQIMATPGNVFLEVMIQICRVVEY